MTLAQITIDLQQGGSGTVPTMQEVQAWHLEKAMLLFQKYPFVAALLALMLIDIVTGVMAGWVAKKLCSTTSFRGMVGKVQILAMVATAMLFEVVVPNVPWGQFVSIFFIVTECISITENAANSGVPIPRQWAEALKKARQDAAEKAAPPPTVQLTAKEVNVQDSRVSVEVRRDGE